MCVEGCGTRRLNWRLVLLLFVLFLGIGQASASEYLVYVGTYTGKGSEGIYAYRFDPDTGATSPVMLAAATENPSFLATDPTGRFLYAVNELENFQGAPTGAVSAFAIDQTSAKLTALQQVSSLGAGPAHVSVDTTGRFLFAANYNSGNYAVFPIGSDGRLGPHTAFVQDVGSSVNADRQAGPHAHSIQATPDNRFVLVADLGIDQVRIDRFNAHTGRLAPARPAFVKVTPGAGPRHVAFAPSGRFVYLVSEMGSAVTVFAYDPDHGILQPQQTVSTLTKAVPGNRAAEIAIDASGRFLYVSNRGDDSLVVFRVDAGDGRLAALQWIASGGKNPRHFTIDPTGRWLSAANQDTNNISLFQIESNTGRLTPTERSLPVVEPVCVLFVPRQ